MRRFLSLDDFEAAARRRLPSLLYGFIAGGAETDAARRDNRAAFDELALVPSVLADVSARTATHSFLGRTYAAPFGIAPMGMAAMMGYRADLAMARAAAAADIPMVLSGSSLARLEDVATANPQAWFQAYLPGDPREIDAMVDRVECAGYETLVVTVDVPVPANREHNERAGYTTPLRPSLRLAWQGITHPRWSAEVFLQTRWRLGPPHFENFGAERGPPALSRDLSRSLTGRDRLTWDHLARIRGRWRGHLVVKGVLAAADACRAQQMDVDAVILSNHGGRQLDHAVSPLRMIESVRQAAAGLPVIVDGGVRRGTDVLKALALGADFVLVGRPFLFAAAVGGEAGVRRAAQLLQEEIVRDMALMGIDRLDALNLETLTRREWSLTQRARRRLTVVG